MMGFGEFMYEHIMNERRNLIEGRRSPPSFGYVCIIIHPLPGLHSRRWQTSAHLSSNNSGTSFSGTSLLHFYFFTVKAPPKKQKATGKALSDKI